MQALKAHVRNGYFVIDERTDLPEGTEVELQLVKVPDSFADMAPEDRDELEKAIEEGFETLKTATTSAPGTSWHSCEPRTLEGRTVEASSASGHTNRRTLAKAC
jgi:hypothetical protein